MQIIKLKNNKYVIRRINLSWFLIGTIYEYLDSRFDVWWCAKAPYGSINFHESCQMSLEEASDRLTQYNRNRK